MGSLPSSARIRDQRGLLINRSVYRATLVSVGASLINQALLLVTGLLSARILGVSNRGYLALLTLIVLAFALLGNAGMPLAVTYWVARTPRLERAVIRAVRPVLYVQAGVCLLLQAASLLVITSGASSAVKLAATISLIATPTTLLMFYALALIQGQQRMYVFNGLRSFGPALYSGALVIVFVSGTHSLAVVVGMYVLTSATVGGIAWSIGIRRAKAVTERDEANVSRRAMLKFGLAGLLGEITPLDSFNLDQIIVGLVLSPHALGYYVVAVGFTNVPRFIGQSVGFVAFPHNARLTERAAVRRSTVQFLAITLTLSIPIVAVVELTLPWLIPHLYGPAFGPAIGIARILMVSGLLVGVRKVLADCARGAGMPRLGTEAEVVALTTFVLAASISSAGTHAVARALVVSSCIALVPLARMFT